MGQTNTSERSKPLCPRCKVNETMGNRLCFKCIAADVKWLGIQTNREAARRLKGGR